MVGGVDLVAGVVGLDERNVLLNAAGADAALVARSSDSLFAMRPRQSGLPDEMNDGTARAAVGSIDPAGKEVAMTGLVDHGGARSPKNQEAVTPPSMRTSLPVMKAPSGPRRSAATVATSSGVPPRPTGDNSSMRR